MIVNGRELKVTLEEIPVSKIEPDLEQPRRYEIQLDLQSKGMSTDAMRNPEGIQFATRFEELVSSIIENQGISMPLVVEKLNGKYKIIDGDRRLGAVKRILEDEEILKRNPSLKEKLANLPCLIVYDQLGKLQKLRLLSHIHIHLAEWRPIAKQKVALELADAVGEDKTAAVMALRTTNIAKAKEEQELAKRFTFKGPKSVSYARELNSIKKNLVNDEVIDITIRKVKEGRITDSVDLRKLRKILADPEAKRVYLNPESTIEEAETVLKSKEFKKSLEKQTAVGFDELLDRLVTTLKTVTFEELTEYKGSKDVHKKVEDAISVLTKFKEYI